MIGGNEDHVLFYNIENLIANKNFTLAFEDVHEKLAVGFNDEICISLGMAAFDDHFADVEGARGGRIFINNFGL